MKNARILILFIIALMIASIAVVYKVQIRKGLDIAGGMRVVLQADTEKLPPDHGKWTEADLQSVLRIISKRVNATGVSEPLIQRKGMDQVVVEMPAIENEQEMLDLLKSTAQLQFMHFKKVHFENAVDYRPAAGKYTIEITTDDKGDPEYSFYDVDGNKVDLEQIMKESDEILTGAQLKPECKPQPDQQRPGSNSISLTFNQDGKRKFSDFTRRNVGEILAIILDGKILSVPVIQVHIPDGRAEITGTFTALEAKTLAEFLNAGALPVPLEVVQTSKVEATLGQGSLDQSVKAGLYGLIAVVLFMMVYYLLPGFVADIALVFYAVLTLAVFNMLRVTLTLPGIAAFILSIGMAVDANILIFERLKEELRAGKTLHAAIDAGFKRAFTSIFDSNMCTAITCAILIGYGTGPIKGFGVVLLIGVAISMFTAITVTRTILHVIEKTSLAQNPGLFALGRQWVVGQSGSGTFNTVRYMGVWLVLSLVLIGIGMYFWVGPPQGLKEGIDFAGGSYMQVQLEQPVENSEILARLDEMGLTGSMVQRSGDDERTVFIRTKAVNEAQTSEINSMIENTFKGKVLSLEMVGPVISKELKSNAVKAIIFASIAIVIYLTIRFAVGGIAYGFRFGICAIIALLHDVAVVIGTFAIMGHLKGWEVDSLFVTALLTVIGFSVHDTIVIFDRIRENMKHRIKGESFDSLVNKSILQSFARSINTSVTVVITLLALLLFGAVSLKLFIIALLVGVVSGTYSSIFNASQLLVLWQRLSDGKPAFVYEAVAASAPAVRPVEQKPLVEKPVVEDDDSSDEESKAKSGKAKTAKKKKRRF